MYVCIYTHTSYTFSSLILMRCVLCVEADGVTGEGPLPEISERSQAVRRTSVQINAGRKCKHTHSFTEIVEISEMFWHQVNNSNIIIVINYNII